MSAASLAAAARRAAQESYSPYSSFRVGAVVVDAEGVEHAGCNVENAAYGSSVCAEVTAIVGAVSRGVRRLTTLAVACIDTDDVDGAYPCGNCRQTMHEFGVERVIVTAADGTEIREHSLEELHPHGFTLE